VDDDSSTPRLILHFCGHVLHFEGHEAKRLDISSSKFKVAACKRCCAKRISHIFCNSQCQVSTRSAVTYLNQTQSHRTAIWIQTEFRKY
jgi:hypothetical protein